MIHPAGDCLSDKLLDIIGSGSMKEWPFDWEEVRVKEDICTETRLCSNIAPSSCVTDSGCSLLTHLSQAADCKMLYHDWCGGVMNPGDWVFAGESYKCKKEYPRNYWASLSEEWATDYVSIAKGRAAGEAAVKAAVEACYPSMGITCDEVGEYQSSGVVFSGMAKCTDPVASSSCDVCREKLFEGHCGAFSQEAKGKWDDWTYFSLGEPDCISDVCCASNEDDCCELNVGAVVGTAIGAHLAHEGDLT